MRNSEKLWPHIPLGELAEIERNAVSPENIKSGTKYVGLENMTSSGSFVGVAEVATGDLASTKFAFTDRHILYGKLRPYLAKIARPRFPGVCSTDILPILPGSKVDPGFLLHFLRQPRMVDYASSKTTGANLPRLSPKALAEFEIPLPSLSEQKRIADILDKADSIRRKRQQAINELQKLDNCLFEETFGSLAQEINQWPTALLDDVLFFQEGPGVRNWQFTDSGVKLLNVRNLVDGRLELGNTDRFLSEEEAYGKYRHFLVETDDLVMATSGVTWGKTAWVNSSHLPLCMNTSTVRFRPLNEERVTRSYMHAFLKSRFFTRQIDRLVTGSAQPNFGPSHLKQVEMTIPDLESQLQYQQRFKRFTALLDKNINVLHSANNLFNSLVQRAFTGEL
jgi:type I restriction enzyme S subunit